MEHSESGEDEQAGSPPDAPSSEKRDTEHHTRDEDWLDAVERKQRDILKKWEWLWQR